MSILKYIYSSKSIRGKIIRIKEGIKDKVRPLCIEKFWIEKYGAYDIDPKNLVFWICVETDEAKDILASNSELTKTIRQLFDQYDYPKEARDSVYIGYESQQTVDRESNGDWYVHFK